MTTQRISKLRQYLADGGIDALYCRSTTDITWLTGVSGVFDTEQAHMALISPQDALVHTDSRYSHALRCALESEVGIWQVDDSRVSHARCALERVALLGKGQNCEAGSWECAPIMGIDLGLTLGEYRQLEKESAGQVQFLETSNVVLNLRSVKDEAEIAAMERAQHITDAAFAHMAQWMRPGMTERQVARELDRTMMEFGAQGLAFDTIVATGPNAANPHHVSDDTRLEPGHLVVMDFGARLAGYCSDMTRCVSVGEPDEYTQNVYEAVRFANETVEARLSVGMRGIDAHTLAEECLASRGFAGRMGHGLGHGVGLDIHEEPCLNLRNQSPLVAGNVVTVEPGVYVPGRIGCRLEDFGVVTPGGFHVFTQTSHELVII